MDAVIMFSSISITPERGRILNPITYSCQILPSDVTVLQRPFRRKQRPWRHHIVVRAAANRKHDRAAREFARS